MQEVIKSLKDCLSTIIKKTKRYKNNFHWSIDKKINFNSN